jgi:hypothetical protein
VDEMTVKKTVTVAGLVAVLALVVLFLTGTIKTYGLTEHALNAGVVVGNCGVEVKGDPGVFCTHDGGLH